MFRTLTGKLILVYFILLHLALGIVILKSTLFSHTLSYVYSLFSAHDRRNVYTDSMEFQLRVDCNVPDGSALFFGDSIIKGMAVAAVFNPSVNFGIGGDSSYTLRARIVRYSSIKKARVIVIGVGLNDLISSSRSDSTIVELVSDSLHSLPCSIPKVVISILPVDEACTGRKVNSRIREINRIYDQVLCQYPNTYVVDLSPMVVNDVGNLRSELHIGDGIHLNKKGYEILIGYLKSELNVIAGSESNSLELKSNWPPSSKISIHPASRDTWMSSASGEENGSNGGSEMLKLKGQQEYGLLDIDTSPLKGSVVTGALIHLRSASPRKNESIARLGVSSISSAWTEGASTNYKPTKGSACFSQAEYQIRDWAYPGSTVLDVVLGRGNTIWKFADCSLPDSNGWQACAVDPDVVAARVAGLSHGFFLYDEVGHTWSLKNGKFDYVIFPNRFCYSRESRGSAPWMEIWTELADSMPPDAIDAIHADSFEMPAGQAVVRWKTPRDNGGGKTLGFNVSYHKGGEERELPRYLIPMAASPGEEVPMHLQGLPFDPGESITLTIRPVDSAGNIGPAFTGVAKLSSGPPAISIPEADIGPFEPSSALPSAGGVKLAVVDLLDKIDPVTGKMIPAQAEGYKSGNHIYSAKEKRIRLQSARNETVAFQLNLEGAAPAVKVHYAFGETGNLCPRVFQFAYVNASDETKREAFMLPDPLLELSSACSIPSAAGLVRVPNQANVSLICELYVPHDEPPGIKRGELTVSVGEETVKLDVDLTIWNFTLPDKLSFVPEMNAYGTASPYQGYEYYQLAHEHRACLNRLPYGWDGIPSFAPSWNGQDFDWPEWDHKVGPLLDGSAFKDLPRRNEPVDVLYLPFSENWPMPVWKHYTPSYWADEAFSEEYKRGLQKAFASFAAHCAQKRWPDTAFQFYLNNKVQYRQQFTDSSAPWLFDEPVNTQDFWALRWFGILWHESVDPVKGDAKMEYRADISYSQFERNILSGITDIEYLGDNNAQKTRMKQDEKIYYGRADFAEYGNTNSISSSNMQPPLWCISAWAKGAVGVLPWQTIGTAKSWTNAERTALFYPHPDGPKPSVRLKAFTRGQQDVEYLTLLSTIRGNSRASVVNWLGTEIDLGSLAGISSGAISGAGPDPAKLWSLRYRIGKELSREAPAYRRSLIDRKPVQLNTVKLPRIGYVPVSPQFERLQPDVSLDN